MPLSVMPASCSDRWRSFLSLSIGGSPASVMRQPLRYNDVVSASDATIGMSLSPAPERSNTTWATCPSAP